jgi:hypothetical protein
MDLEKTDSEKIALKNALSTKVKIVLVANIIILIACLWLFVVYYKKNVYSTMTLPIITHTIVLILFIGVAVLYGLQLSYYLVEDEMLATDNIYAGVNYKIEHDTLMTNSIVSGVSIISVIVIAWLLLKKSN